MKAELIKLVNKLSVKQNSLHRDKQQVYGR